MGCFVTLSIYLISLGRSLWVDFCLNSVMHSESLTETDPERSVGSPCKPVEPSQLKRETQRPLALWDEREKQRQTDRSRQMD